MTADGQRPAVPTTAAGQEALGASDDEWRRVMSVNCDGVFFMCRAAVQQMKQQAPDANNARGAIVNFGSIWAELGGKGHVAYCASKGALTTLTANTAFSVMSNRIRVNQLNVGWMASDHEREIQADGGDPDWEAKAAAALPFGRLVDPAEAARAVNFLVSEDAGLMTGAIVNFDQSVWGAVAAGMPVPEGPMQLPQ